MCDLIVDFQKEIGYIKPVHGVVNGPYNDVFPWVDVTDRYREAGVPFVRLHDTLYPNAPEVDIHTIFPDFSADPGNPGSYDFDKTDLYLEKIHATGAEIYYRLGESIEHHRVKKYIMTPKDIEKWAEICVGIVKHYNDGWAEGFHYGIKVWEVWEEADNKERLWLGSEEEFYRLYEATARAIKNYDSGLLVGGYAAANIELPFFNGFLDHVKKNAVPLDFVTYDVYTNNPQEIARRAYYTQNLLDQYGMDAVDVRIAEWNNLGFVKGSGIFQGSPELLTQKLENQHGLPGAAFYTAGMLLMQDAPVKNAAMYAFNTTSEWSVFNLFGKPYKAYYAFVAFKRLYDHNRRVYTEVSGQYTNVYCCAGKNQNGRAAVLISNFDGEAKEYKLQLIPEDKNKEYRYDVYRIDKARDLELIDTGVSKGVCEYSCYLPQYCVLELIIQ